MTSGMVTLSRSASLDSAAAATGAAPPHPPSKAEEAVANSRRQRSFTGILRSLASKFTSSNASIPAAAAGGTGEGATPAQGPPTWEDAMETAFAETAARATDDYDDDGDLPAELVAMMDTRPAGGEEGDKDTGSIDELGSRLEGRATLDEWIEL